MASLPYDPETIDPDALTLVNRLSGVLEALIAYFDQQGVSLPDRRYWTVGPSPTWDCAQVVVSASSTFLGTPGDQGTTPNDCVNTPTSVNIEIMILREAAILTAKGNIPAAEKIQELSQAPAVDAWLLSRGLSAILSTDEVTGMPPAVIASLNLLSPQGGYHGVRMVLTTAVF